MKDQKIMNAPCRCYATPPVMSGRSSMAVRLPFFPPLVLWRVLDGWCALHVCNKPCIAMTGWCVSARKTPEKARGPFPGLPFLTSIAACLWRQGSLFFFVCISRPVSRGDRACPETPESPETILWTFSPFEAIAPMITAPCILADEAIGNTQQPR